MIKNNTPNLGEEIGKAVADKAVARIAGGKDVRLGRVGIHVHQNGAIEVYWEKRFYNHGESPEEAIKLARKLLSA